MKLTQDHLDTILGQMSKCLDDGAETSAYEYLLMLLVEYGEAEIVKVIAENAYMQNKVLTSELNRVKKLDI